MTEVGTFLKYREIKFRGDSEELIGRVCQVTEEYEARGLCLSVRQVFYQFVARGWLPNSLESYGKIQKLISDGRLAGLVSWTAIEDRGRALRGLSTRTSPSDAIKAARRSYRLDLWRLQKIRPEVWVEKQALEGVLESVCNELRVDFYATRGYDSQSQSWEAGRRFAGYAKRGQIPVIFHLGDHDPSGVDMTRDNHVRLSEFAGFPVNVQRIALNIDQVRQYDPPPNPAKLSDSRAADYVDKFGYESWELDALDPSVLQALIRSAVESVRDEALWSQALAEEVEDLRVLQDVEEQVNGE